MLKPINDELWINTNNITKITQSGSKVYIYFNFAGADVVELENSSVDEVAKYLNSQTS